MKPIIEIIDLIRTRLFVVEWVHTEREYGPVVKTELTGPQHTWRDQFETLVDSIRRRDNLWQLVDQENEPQDYVAIFGRIEFPIIRD